MQALVGNARIGDATNGFRFAKLAGPDGHGKTMFSAYIVLKLVRSRRPNRATLETFE